MKKRTKTLLVLVAVLTAGFVLALVLFYSGENYRRAVESYKKELRSRGENLDLAKFARPSGSNAALAVQLFVNAARSYSVAYNAPSVQRIAPGVQMVAYTHFALEQLADYEREKAVTASLRQALADPAFDFTFDYGAEIRGGSALMTYLPVAKQAELTTMDAARKALAQGDGPEAAQDLEAGVDVLLKGFEQPTLISDLVRIADAAINTSATWEALQSDQLTDQQWKELGDRWQAADLFSHAEPSLAAERAMAIETYQYYRQSRDAFAGQYLTQVSVQASQANPANRPLSVAEEVRNAALRWYALHPKYWAWSGKWSYDEELALLETYDAQLAAVRTIRTNGAFVPALRTFDQAETRILARHPGRQHYVQLSLGTGQRNYLLKVADAETGRRLLIAAIALKRFQMAHHACPAALSELVPQYLPKVPNDFMDGQPLRYQCKTDGSFLLYSVGENGVDDGGDPVVDPPNSTNSWMKARDIVWPRAATPQESEAFEKTQQKSAVGVQSR